MWLTISINSESTMQKLLYTREEVKCIGLKEIKELNFNDSNR